MRPDLHAVLISAEARARARQEVALPVRAPGVRPGLLAGKAAITDQVGVKLDPAPANSHRREALRVHHLQQAVRLRLQPQAAQLDPRQTGRCDRPHGCL